MTSRHTFVEWGFLIPFFTPFEETSLDEFVCVGSGPHDLAKPPCKWSFVCLERTHLQPGIKVELVLVAVDQRRSVRHG